MPVRQWSAWPENAILPSATRHVDPTRDWIPSPGAQAAPLPPGPSQISDGFIHNIDGEKPVWDRRGSGSYDQVVDPPKRRVSRLSFRYWRDLLGPKRRKDVERKPSPGAAVERHIEPTSADWREYGYWARPVINQVQVRNATPPPVPRKLNYTQIEAIMGGLSLHGKHYPDSWIAGVDHPSLPPHPDLWFPILPLSMQPRPRDLRLNPFLEHRLFGAPPMLYDLRWHNPEQPQVELGEEVPESDTERPRAILFDVSGPNGAQPATHPGVSEMKITMLADDALPVFPWPFIVNAHHDALPVTMCDVIMALVDNFKERMTQAEVNSLDPRRKQIMEQAYWNRLTAMAISNDDGIRRVDYLGGNYMFRGLEPAPDGEGFMLFVGAP